MKNGKPASHEAGFDSSACIIFIVGVNQRKYHHRSIRLGGYDYSSAGAYFVTLAAYQRQCLFGEVKDEQMVLSPIGKIVLRKEICLDPEDFVVMPNHIHGVVQIIGTESVEAHGVRPVINSGGRRPPLQRPPRSLSSFIAGFKSAVTQRAMAFDETIPGSVWQRNYYEHIIRDEREWARIRAYIETNPVNWERDEENPDIEK